MLFPIYVVSVAEDAADDAVSEDLPELPHPASPNTIIPASNNDKALFFIAFNSSIYVLFYMKNRELLTYP